MSDLITADELDAALKKCPEWETEGEKITRTIDIRYTLVTVALTTHDVGGVTELDIQLAQRVDNLVD